MMLAHRNFAVSVCLLVICVIFPLLDKLSEVYFVIVYFGIFCFFFIKIVSGTIKQWNRRELLILIRFFLHLPFILRIYLNIQFQHNGLAYKFWSICLAWTWANGRKVVVPANAVWPASPPGQGSSWCPWWHNWLRLWRQSSGEQLVLASNELHPGDMLRWASWWGERRRNSCWSSAAKPQTTSTPSTSSCLRSWNSEDDGLERQRASHVLCSATQLLCVLFTFDVSSMTIFLCSTETNGALVNLLEKKILPCFC